MSTISNEIIERLDGCQNQIWQTVALTASESANVGLTFSSPETSSVAISELYSQISEAALVIQFSFANLPENSQIVLIDEETFSQLAGEIRGAKVTEIDDAFSTDIPSMLLGIWNRPNRGEYGPTFQRDVRIEQGVLEYVLPTDWPLESSELAGVHA